MTLELLQNLKYETKDLRSKSWEEFSKEDSPEIDFVFTVCGSAAEETCPVWQGTPLSAHWGIDDPAAKEGTASVRMQAFQQAFSQMYQRIDLFLNLPLHSLERLQSVCSPSKIIFIPVAPFLLLISLNRVQQSHSFK